MEIEGDVVSATHTRYNRFTKYTQFFNCVSTKRTTNLEWNTNMGNYVDIEKLANLVRNKRLNRGLRETAKEIGNVSPSTISRVENGKMMPASRRNPKGRTRLINTKTEDRLLEDWNPGSCATSFCPPSFAFSLGCLRRRALGCFALP